MIHRHRSKILATEIVGTVRRSGAVLTNGFLSEILLGAAGTTVARGLQVTFVMIAGRPPGMQAGASQSIWTIAVARNWIWTTGGHGSPWINGETETEIYGTTAGAAKMIRGQMSGH